MAAATAAATATAGWVVLDSHPLADLLREHGGMAARAACTPHAAAVRPADRRRVSARVLLLPDADAGVVPAAGEPRSLGALMAHAAAGAPAAPARATPAAAAGANAAAVLSGVHALLAALQADAVAELDVRAAAEAAARAAKEAEAANAATWPGLQVVRGATPGLACCCAGVLHLAGVSAMGAAFGAGTVAVMAAGALTRAAGALARTAGAREVHALDAALARLRASAAAAAHAAAQLERTLGRAIRAVADAELGVRGYRVYVAGSALPGAAVPCSVVLTGAYFCGGSGCASQDQPAGRAGALGDAVGRPPTARPAARGRAGRCGRRASLLDMAGRTVHMISAADPRHGGGGQRC